MVWGCFSYKGVGRLEIIDSYKYQDIISRNLFASATLMGWRFFMFQQDNDPKHTSRLTKDYFETKRFNLLEWLSQSPDLNPIVNQWYILKIKVQQRLPENLNELKIVLEEEWNNILVETCRKLALSFRKKTIAVLRAKGDHLKN